jgi:perosamine synthetase
MYKFQHSAAIAHSKPYIDEKDVEAVAKQVRSAKHATGERVKEFEDILSTFIAKKYAKATSSGTAALDLALISLGIKDGDEVIFPSYVCQSLLDSVNHRRAKAVLADIQDDFQEKGYNISARTINPLLTKNTKAIIVPHMFGRVTDIEEIIKFGIPVIEDCAQSLGTSYNGSMAGSFSDLAILSFYATKMISTGRGGMILTSRKELSDKIEDLTECDKRQRYNESFNCAMTDIQAALGISQFDKLSDFIARRSYIADLYDQEFSKTSLKLSKRVDGSIPFRYIVNLDNERAKESLEKNVKAGGIAIESPVFKPLHRYFNLDPDNFKNTEDAYQSALSIPIYPALRDEEVERIIRTIIG